MDPALASRRRFPPEVLNHVGDVDVGAIDPGILQGAVEDPAGGADEGVALDVLSVARLLADEHHAGSLRSLAEDRLRRVAIQVAALTALDGLGEGVQGAFRGKGSVCGVLGHPDGPTRFDRTGNTA